MNPASIEWNGKNTEEVVRFCVDWEYDLCSIHREFTNLVTGERTLEIEPSDTMRGRCLDIPIGAKCERAEKNGRCYIDIKE